MAKSDLDLHGFRPEDVTYAVDQFLYRHGQMGTKSVRIMTGKGKGVVKKIVVNYLKQGGFPWEYEKKKDGSANEGVLCIFLD